MKHFLNAMPVKYCLCVEHLLRLSFRADTLVLRLDFICCLLNMCIKELNGFSSEAAVELLRYKEYRTSEKVSFCQISMSKLTNRV